MKASELRIGNWVSCGLSTSPNNWYQILDGETIDLTSDITEGIYLTDEWLLKFGLGEIEENFRDYFNDEIYLEYSIDEWDDEDRGEWLVFVQHSPKVKDILRKSGDFDEEELRDYVPCKHMVQYVHQLQNLYFALTGEELTIKI